MAPSWLQKLMIPPAARNSGVSPTVSTIRPRTTSNAWLYLFCCERLTNRMWHEDNSCGFCIQRISTRRPWTVVPRVISAREVPKENSQQRCIRRRQYLGRPIHKAGKIRQIIGLCKIFGGGGVLGRKGH